MPPKSQKLALAAVFLTLTAFALTATSIPSLATTIAADLATRDESMGYIFMLQFLCFAVASTVGGRIRQRFGIADRTLVMTGILAMAVLFATAYAVSTFTWLLLWIIPVGLAGGLTETFACVIVAKLGSRDSSKLLNLAQVFFCAGAIAAPYLVGIMLVAQIPWRSILLILSGFILLIGFFFIAATGTLTPTPSLPSNPPTAPPPRTSHRDRTFILLAAAIFLYVSVELAGASWLAVYFQRNFDLSPGDAAWRQGLFWTGVIVGRGALLILPHRWTVWPPAIACPIGMTIGAVLIACSPSSLTASAAVLFYGLSAGPLWPVIIAISHNYRNSTRFTTEIIAFGALGAAVGPLFGAWLIRFAGLAFLFPAIALGSTALLLTTLAAKKNLARPTSN